MADICITVLPHRVSREHSISPNTFMCLLQKKIKIIPEYDRQRYVWLASLNCMPELSFGHQCLLNFKNRDNFTLYLIVSWKWNICVHVYVFFPALSLQNKIILLVLFYFVVIREWTLNSQMTSKCYKTTCMFMIAKLRNTL